MEDPYIGELLRYVSSTYKKHYAQSGQQTIVEIINQGDGIGFSKGNIRKYLNRYGHKGTVDDARLDILKLLHNALYLLISHDKENENAVDETGQGDTE